MTVSDEIARPSAANAPAGRPPRRVFVRDLELMASVGVYEVERRYEQRIVVSLDLAVRDDYDGVSDRLDDVLDYAAIVRTVTRIVEAGHVCLIETLAERFAEAILADARVESVQVRVAKPDVLPSVRAVGIEILRTRAMLARPA